MKLQAADPELVSLRRGTAPAGLVADALQGKLSPIPMSPEQRQEAATKAEVQQLMDANPYRSGNLTQAMRLEQLNPAAAKRLRQESGVQSPAEKQAAAEAAQQQHEKALAANVEAGRLQMQARAKEAARQSLNS